MEIETSRPTRTEILVALERAGAAMGNVMYNMVQHTIENDNPELFDKLRRAWDRAYGDMQQINHLTGTPSYEALAERVASLEVALDEKDESYWTDGEPPFPYGQEWFIAKTIYGDKVVLKALPKEFTYDYKTADETYIAARNIKCWMQFPDSQFKHFKSTAPQPVEAAKGGEPVADGLHFMVKGWGETDFPEIIFAATLDAAKDAVIAMVYDDPSGGRDQADEEKLLHGLDGERDLPWEVLFEIGGVEVCKVFVRSATPPAPTVAPSELEAKIRAMRCVNPYPEDNCNLYKEGYAVARQEAAEILAAATREQK